MPVCITGMHRSGTSLVANLLRSCGLYLGKEDELLPPSPDNLDGYWENRRFVGISDEILITLGSAWDSPSTSAAEVWPFEERFNSLRVRAEILVEEFTEHEPWGWKDPRTSLTLPFWQSLNGMLMPFWLGRGQRLKIVVCLRDPMEVFQSLQARHFTPSLSGLDLWLTYNRRILDTVLPEDRIVTHYDAYFENPCDELKRVLDFAGLAVSPEVIQKSARIVSSSLRHKRSSVTSQSTANVNSEVIDLYEALCTEANHLQPLNSYSTSR